MDGAPVKGESIPIRVFLAGYDLTPTMRDINKKFSVRYYLNLVLVDEEDRRYFKQQVSFLVCPNMWSWTLTKLWVISRCLYYMPAAIKVFGTSYLFQYWSLKFCPLSTIKSRILIHCSNHFDNHHSQKYNIMIKNEFSFIPG